MKRLLRRPTIWFTISASTIGATNPTTSVHRLIEIVFFISVQNSGLSKNCWKYWDATHSPPVRPWVKSNLRNASWMPYMGRYANTRVTTTAGATITHSCHFVRRCLVSVRRRRPLPPTPTGVLGTFFDVSSSVTATRPPPSRGVRCGAHPDLLRTRAPADLRQCPARRRGGAPGPCATPAAQAPDCPSY